MVNQTADKVNTLTSKKMTELAFLKQSWKDLSFQCKHFECLQGTHALEIHQGIHIALNCM